MPDGGDFPGGKGGGPTPFSNAFKPATIASLRYNTSQGGSPVPICYGTHRVSINLIEFWGEQGFGSTSKGGKGLGSSGGKKGSGANYSVDVAFGLCQGPVGDTGAPNAFCRPAARPMSIAFGRTDRSLVSTRSGSISMPAMTARRPTRCLRAATPIARCSAIPAPRTSPARRCNWDRPRPCRIFRRRSPGSRSVRSDPVFRVMRTRPRSSPIC